jgi:glycosyltransferase involved in cell wall biosynthesis
VERWGGATLRGTDRLRVFVNAGGSNSGGGQTWVLGLLRELTRGGDRDLHWDVLIRRDLAERIEPVDPRIVAIHHHAMSSAPVRMAWEQLALPLAPAVRRADVLISAANFAPLGRTRPHILLARNALHFDELQIAGPQRARIRAEALLARASVRAATATVTASEAMATRVYSYTGLRPEVIPFGPGLISGREPTGEGRFVFTHRTFWGAHKRFGELLEAVRELAALEPGRFVLRTACDPRTPFARKWRESGPERALLADPLVARHVEFETFPAGDVSALRADAVVLPSTLESFCFPLAEAVGAGVPVVAAASDFAREMCGASALYADPADPARFAAAMREAMRGSIPPPSPERRRRISWSAHVDGLAALCRRLSAGVNDHPQRRGVGRPSRRPP